MIESCWAIRLEMDTLLFSVVLFPNPSPELSLVDAEIWISKFKMGDLIWRVDMQNFALLGLELVLGGSSRSLITSLYVKFQNSKRRIHYGSWIYKITIGSGENFHPSKAKFYTSTRNIGSAILNFDILREDL